MDHRTAIRFAAAVFATATATSAEASDETITDETFTDADWTVVTLRDDPTGSASNLVGGQQTTGGNPDDYRFVSNSWTHDGVGSATVVAGHLRAEADYRPTSQGEVDTVDFTFDVRTDATTYQTESLLLFFPLIFQSDAYYAPSEGAEATDAWGSFTSGPLAAEDFTRYAGDPSAPTTPDLSGLGAPLTFGFAVRVGPHALAGEYFTEGGIDNLTIEIREPGSTGGSGAGGNGTGGGSASQGAGLGPSGQPGTTVPREEGGCGCRLGGPQSGTRTMHRLWWALGLCL
ncbi:MAG: hypothetical protein JRI23_27615, partial [Deltaproteobacteria bacterium]|nr:hypothetical protein [Deltaproteobacteria bacterium]MBW2535849.1 hypothetical protein [Deltaproteobacteria bacterium]